MEAAWAIAKPACLTAASEIIIRLSSPNAQVKAADPPKAGTSGLEPVVRAVLPDSIFMFQSDDDNRGTDDCR